MSSTCTLSTLFAVKGEGHTNRGARMPEPMTVRVESPTGEILRSSDPRVVAACVNAAVDCVARDAAEPSPLVRNTPTARTESEQ